MCECKKMTIIMYVGVNLLLVSGAKCPPSKGFVGWAVEQGLVGLSGGTSRA